MIQIDNIVKEFDKEKVLKGVSLNVQKGSVYGLVGPNGAGKTTLIKLVTGIYESNSGTILIDGENINKNMATKEKVYYMPDDLFYPPRFTIKDIIKFYREMYTSFDFNMCSDLQATLRLDNKKRISKLSKGMKKQLAFIIGLCIQPMVMILDEPIDGLDPVVRKYIWSKLLQEVADRQMSVLISSHNLRELEGVCDTIGILHNGEVIAQKSLDELKGNIQKVQVVASDESIFNQIDYVHIERTGSVTTLIIRGEYESVHRDLNRYDFSMIDYIPLSLEEVFIYELGGVGYEIQSLISE